MADYRRFLAASAEVVAPWVGGATISTADRTIRLSVRPDAHGWYRFEVKGREAKALSKTDAPDLSALPRVRGHAWKQRIVVDGARAIALALLPEEELPTLAPISARKWHDGTVLFDQLEFEGDAEGPAREALATGTGLTSVKGASATLRAAYAFALTERASRRLELPASPTELRPYVGAIASDGNPSAEHALRALQAERDLALKELAELRARMNREELQAELAEARAARLREQEAAIRERRGLGLDAALEVAMERAGARLESIRRLGEDQIEVVFNFMDERFISVANATTWQVTDSGICLGHPPRDDLITLESLPSVIREAIETDQLVILRYP